MPSIRAWNGGAWVNPQWRTSSGWFAWRAPVAGVQPYVWDFSSSQGWVQSDGGGGWYAATSTGAEIRCAQPHGGAPYFLTHQIGPLTYPGAPVENIKLAIQVRTECWLMPTDMYIQIEIEYPTINRGTYASIRYGGNIGHTWITTPTASHRDAEPPLCKIYGGADDQTNVPDYGFYVYMDNAHVQDSAGNVLTVGADPGYAPKYWDGASWVTTTG